MDPDANLREQRDIAARVQSEMDAVPDDTAPTTDQLIDWSADLNHLATLVQELNLWIINGGFLPADWTTRNTYTRPQILQGSFANDARFKQVR